MGRKLSVRLHLAVFLLQKLYDLTDRQVEYGLLDNAAYRLFCGFGVVDKWHAPDHTKVEDFRSRLSPETQRALRIRPKITWTRGVAYSANGVRVSRRQILIYLE
jgi:hypothetical protein